VTDDPLDPFAVAEKARGACLEVLADVSDDELDLATACSEYTVAGVAEHLCRSMTLLGTVGGHVAGADPGADGGADLPTRIGRSASEAIASWRQRGLDGTVQIGSSSYSAALAVEIVSLELLVHAWDIADATGRSLHVDPDVAAHVLACARRLVTADKRGRGFAADVPVDPHAPALQHLVAFTGRAPVGLDGRIRDARFPNVNPSNR